MIVYVVTCENCRSGEKYIENVFSEENDAIDYINRKSQIYMGDYFCDYAAFEVKGEMKANATL